MKTRKITVTLFDRREDMGRRRWPVAFLALLGLVAFWWSADAARAAATEVLYPIAIGESHGAIDRSGKVVIPAEYDQPVVFKDGIARVRKGSRTAYLDVAGKRLIEPQEMTDALFTEGLAPARGPDAQGKSRMGYLDRNGAWVIPPRFDDAKEFSNGLAVVGMADEWGKVKFGYVNAKGELAIPARFEKATPFGTQTARVESGGKLMLVDRAGRDVTPADLDWFGLESDGRIMTRKGKLTGFLDASGKTAIAPRAMSAQEFKEGMARIWEAGAYGFIDKRGDVTVKPRFASANDFSEGLAAVTFEGKAGFIDRRGEWAVPPRFDRVQPFSDGLAAAQQAKLWGYIDKSGKWRIEPQFAWARPFQNGLAWAGLPRERGGRYIDQQGATVWRTPQ